MKTTFSNQANTVEGNQFLIKLTIKCYARTVGSDLERYHDLKIIQKNSS